MKRPLLLASLLISSSILALVATKASAQQIRVEKVKGNKALVEFTGDLETGKSYSLSDGKINTASNSNPAGGSRHLLMGGSFGIFSGTDTTAFSSGSISSGSSDMFLSGRFGWNMESYEWGPLFSYRVVDSDYQSLHNTTITAGAFYDYNFTANRPGDNVIVALTGEAGFASLTPKSGTAGSGLTAFAGGTIKWFGIGASTAIRTDLGYSYQKITAGSSNITSSGFALRGGLATYF